MLQSNSRGDSVTDFSVEVERGDGTPTVGGRAPTGAGVDRAFRLVYRTYFEQGEYRGTLRDFGGGLAEFGWSFVQAPRKRKAGRGDSEDRGKNEDRASRRARSRLRHLVLASGASYLLTLTYRANVSDFCRSALDLATFVRLVRRRYPVWPYVAVPELQSRGAWHWHLAVRGWQKVAFLRSAWRQVVKDGNIDVKQPPRLRGMNARVALVRYLSKYLTKAFKGPRELNQHRFRACHGIAVPEQRLILPVRNEAEAQQFARDTLARVAGRVGNFWIADDALAGWASSWG